ncbi:MAG: DEAD/DEAH box helicase [Acidimicrobiia bacterium]|nr:DEAD/DEAH box helicase [Acidimicrobiia bacterium]
MPADLCARLAAAGITEPFPIQRLVIPDALAGRDVSGRAPTGSGKTLAFGLPLVHGLRRASRRRPTALVLAPTRELAEQIATELRPFVRARGHAVVSVYGGVGYGPQRKALDAGAALVVACPGRLEDLMQTGLVTLDDVEHVVIDEADRMADMGFLPAVRRILAATAPTRQVLLFSATFDTAVATLAADLQRAPVRHETGAQGPDMAAADHVFWQVDRTERAATTARAIQAVGSTIVFCRTRHGADRLAKQLVRLGVSAAPIHGGRSQPQRDRALRAFADGQVQALVATDVAARGVHVDGVAAVVHFDPPADASTYVHRSGRTARAGATGVVVSLVEPTEMGAARDLCRHIGIEATIAPANLGDLERRRPVGHQPAPASAPRAAGTARRHVHNARSSAGTRTRGTVTSFHERRGYGFIDRGTGVDLFVHHSSLRDGQAIAPGQAVEFGVRPGRKGEEAYEVSLVPA